MQISNLSIPLPSQYIWRTNGHQKLRFCLATADPEKSTLKTSFFSFLLGRAYSSVVAIGFVFSPVVSPDLGCCTKFRQRCAREMEPLIEFVQSQF